LHARATVGSRGPAGVDPRLQGLLALAARTRGWRTLPDMVLEVAIIEVTPGSEEAFVAAYRAGREGLAATLGCLSVRMTRGVESPSRFVLLVEWESVAAHQDNFRNTERWVTWRGHIGPYFASPPLVEHFIDVPSAADVPAAKDEAAA
jgi:heme-degrading monooxygenase HmoA